jgi:ribosome maturation factor RimP
MNSVTSLATVENLLSSVLAESEDIFLVNLKINGDNIKIFIDGDNGVTIEKCTRINRSLYKKIEEAGVFPDGNFSLEVSSPGIDEPLKLLRQYKKNIGRKVEVTFTDDSKKEGKLIDANENEIVIEETQGKGKKLTRKTTNILFTQIRHTKVLVTF